MSTSSSSRHKAVASWYYERIRTERNYGEIEEKKRDSTNMIKIGNHCRTIIRTWDDMRQDIYETLRSIWGLKNITKWNNYTREQKSLHEYIINHSNITLFHFVLFDCSHFCDTLPFGYTLLSSNNFLCLYHKSYYSQKSAYMDKNLNFQLLGMMADL